MQQELKGRLVGMHSLIFSLPVKSPLPRATPRFLTVVKREKTQTKLGGC